MKKKVPAQPLNRPTRSPLPVARRATDHTIPAMINAELQVVLDDEDAKRSRSLVDKNR